MTERKSKLFVKTLDLKNFRNYESLSLTLDPGTNIFYGANAQGKTNILEAVYLAGTTKSHRGSKDRDIIRMGQEESHIRMTVDRRGNDYRIDVHLKKRKAKGIAINGLPVKRAGDLLDIMSIVFFSPEDLNLIKNGPSERRRFLDYVLCGIDPVYLKDLASYSKCLTQRSRLLKDLGFGRGNLTELDIWDQQLARYGGELIKKRASFLENLQKTAAQIHGQLTGGAEKLELQYEPNVTEEFLMDQLAKNRDLDLKTKVNTVGPHRDDMAIRANEMDLRIYGSQGQQRTAALSLKLAEIEIYEKAKGARPILLLDDVLSELDRDRQNYLLKSLKDTQTLITCTGLDDFVENHFEADHVFHVVRGGIE